MISKKFGNNNIKNMLFIYDFLCFIIFRFFFSKKVEILAPCGKLYSDFKQNNFLVRINNPIKFIYYTLTRGELGLGESYSLNYWNLERGDLGEFLTFCGEHFVDDSGSTIFCKLKKFLPFEWFRLLFFRWKKTHDFNQAKEAVKQAYDDVDSELYNEMLDEKFMQYTSGVYETDETTLEEAQIRKMELLLEKADLPDTKTRILDIGCGWGGLLHYGTSTRKNMEGVGITNSSMMHRETLERASLTNLPFTAERCDFRNINPLLGKFNAIFSVEMIEAIGVNLYNDFARICHEFCLSNGKVVLQVINTTTPVTKERKPHDSFVLTHIFPGCQIPSVEQITESMNIYFDTVSVEHFGKDYAKTLLDWRKRLIENRKKITHVEERIIRGFEYYLSWCEAGFNLGMLNVSQLSFSPKLF